MGIQILFGISWFEYLKKLLTTNSIFQEFLNVHFKAMI